MQPDDTAEAARAAVALHEWVQAWGETIAEGASARPGELFAPDAYWRDLLSFSSAFRTWQGSQLSDALAAAQRYKLSDIRCARDRTPPAARRRSGQSVIEGFFNFSTAVGEGTGYVRLLDERNADGAADRAPAEPYRACLLLTALQTLHGFPERISPPSYRFVKGITRKLSRPISSSYKYRVRLFVFISQRGDDQCQKCMAQAWRAVVLDG